MFSFVKGLTPSVNALRHCQLPQGGAFSALLHRKAARQEVPFILYSVLSIAPPGGAVNKAAGKKKKAMEIFHRFAGASCLTRTGDTLINSQVL